MKVHQVHSHRSDDGDAFIRDPAGGPAFFGSAAAEALAEEFVWSVTGSDDLPDEHKAHGRARKGRGRLRRW